MEKNITSYNPATGESLGQVPITTEEELKEILEKSRKAQASWGALSLKERQDLLTRAGMALEEATEEMATLLSQEMGKPLNRSLGEVGGCARGMGYMAEKVREALEPVTLENRKLISRIEYRPHGVGGIITPWNYPVSMGHWLIVPALMARCPRPTIG